MARTSAVDGFALAYSDTGTPPDGDPRRTAVLLHGWPGDSHDYRHVVPLLCDTVRVIVPDLRGIGESDRRSCDPDAYYSLLRKPEALRD
jgi:pimeloyl-ACP methyl ester carboxylesterase